MKRQALALEPITRALPPRAPEAFLNRYGEQQRQFGDKPTARHPVHLQHHALIQPPSKGLIRRRGIEEPIAKNVGARLECRQNYLAYVLRPVRLVEQEFRGGAQALIARSKEQLANPLPYFRAAGLARGENGESRLFHPRAQARHLG